MSVLSNARLINLEDDRQDLLRAANNSIGQITSLADRVVQYSALIMVDVLNSGSDFSVNDAELIIDQFEDKRQKIVEQVAKLNDVANLRVLDVNGNLDPVATVAAVNAFIAAYALDVTVISKKYDAI